MPNNVDWHLWSHKFHYEGDDVVGLIDALLVLAESLEIPEAEVPESFEDEVIWFFVDGAADILLFPDSLEDCAVEATLQQGISVIDVLDGQISQDIQNICMDVERECLVTKERDEVGDAATVEERSPCFLLLEAGHADKQCCDGLQITSLF